MHRAAWISIVAACLTGSLTPSAHAGSVDGAKIALHVQNHFVGKAPNTCNGDDPTNAGISCNAYQTRTQTFIASDVYLVAVGVDPADGIAELSTGVQADSLVMSFGWTLCADAQTAATGWPQAQGGNTISWSPTANCQTTEPGGFGVHAVAGAFYVYAYADGVFGLAEHDGALPTVTDCQGHTGLVGSSNWGSIGFGTALGFTPCFVDCGCDPVITGMASCCCGAEGNLGTCLTQAECEDLGGTWISFTCGVGEDCTSVCQTVPTIPTSWGRVKSRF